MVGGKTWRPQGLLHGSGVGKGAVGTLPRMLWLEGAPSCTLMIDPEADCVWPPRALESLLKALEKPFQFYQKPDF